MKIVHVIPTLGCGGAEILLGRLALEQKKSGCNVAIVMLKGFHETFDHYPEKELLLQEIPIKLISSSLKIFPRFRSHNNLYEWELFLEQFKPDIIHSHLYEADFLAHSILLPGTSYVTHIHGPIPDFDKKASLRTYKKNLLRRLEQHWLHRRYVKSKTHFVAISNAMYGYAKSIVPAPLHNNIHLLPNAINLSSFPFVKRKELSKTLRLITVGNLLPRKKHDFLIRVIEKLKEDGILCFLEILGYGPLEEELQTLIHSLQLKENVYLRGSVGNVYSYLSHAQIYLHAAQPEPFGLAILEALTTGLPVVTLDGGGTSDLVHDGVNGFLVKENDVNLFANRIKLLLNDQLLYQNMALQAGATSSKFDIGDYSRNMLKVYEKILLKKEITLY